MSRPIGSKNSKPVNRRAYKAELLVGKTIGEWFVKSYQKTKNGTLMFVKCSCGTEGYRRYETIAYGKSSSCGCKHSEIITKKQIKPDNYSAKLKLYNSYKKSAKHRNLEFDLTFDELLQISQLDCFYCNKIPSNLINLKHSKYRYSGIDRVDNARGYTKDNCVPCCIECNELKSRTPLYIIMKVSEFIRGKNV